MLVRAYRALQLFIDMIFGKFDATQNLWTQKANFPGIGRVGARAFAIGNFGYAGTGWSPIPQSDFYKYDPINNIWSAITSFG